MKVFLIATVIGLFIMIGIFVMEEKLISKLSDDHRFKIWWRNHIIGDANSMGL